MQRLFRRRVHGALALETEVRGHAPDGDEPVRGPRASAPPDEADVLGALARIGAELNVAVGTPALAERLCALLAETLACDCAILVLREPDRGVHRAVAAHGFPPEDRASIEALRLPHDALTGLLGELRRSEALQLATIDSPTAWAALPARYGVSRVLYVALQRGDEIVGLQAAGFRGRLAPFTAVQERIARGAAHLAALALENARLIDDLLRADRVKSEFFSTMSHELRTPLNVILGYNDLLLDEALGPLTAEQRDALGDVRRSARMLLTTIDATLELSRLEAGHVRVDVAEIEIRDLLRELLDEAQLIPRDRRQSRLTFTFAPESDLPPLHGDRRKLRALLRNILDNAVKFTDEGSVTVEVRPLEGGLEIAIADTGIGIPPDVLPSIFQRFWQGEPSSTRRHGGVGLGLHVARRLADLLDATIAVESQVGRGSTFRVRLPLRRDVAEAGTAASR